MNFACLHKNANFTGCPLLSAAHPGQGLEREGFPVGDCFLRSADARRSLPVAGQPK